jgi:hypothetical protein
MPILQALLGELNANCGKSGIGQMAQRREDFAPGQPLHSALAGLVANPGTLEHRMFREYVAKIPGSIQETVRGVLHHALSTDPPTLVTFAWAPSYDYEVTIWQAPDTPQTRGGITVLVKSRYPSDKHPLSADSET